jgi:hypothetical protein
MIVDSAKWQETNKHDVYLYQQAQLGPFIIDINVGPDFTHNWIELKGTVLTEPEPHALKNPYYTGCLGEYPYFLPDNTVAKLTKYYIEQRGYTPQRARNKAYSDVVEDMAIALAPDHAGYEAFYILATVHMRIEAGDSSDLITLASRSSMGIEIKTSATAWRAERERKVRTASYSEPERHVEETRQALAVKAERTAKRAIHASLGIIRHIKRDVPTSAFTDVVREIQENKK